MNFEYSEKSIALQEKLTTFFEEHIYPIEEDFHKFQQNPKNLWKRNPIIEDLKIKLLKEVSYEPRPRKKDVCHYCLVKNICIKKVMK